jgi:DNA-directed RNA polymerase sigma subunit (sigma70/sigma32)
MKDQTSKKMTDSNMRAVIAIRVENIRQAHANNLIENMDMGVDALNAMLERAREPISDEEFVRREEALWLERHQAAALAAA